MSKPRATRPHPAVKALSERVEALEKRVEALETLQDPYAHLRGQTAKRGRGKPPRLDDAELQGRRNRLIDWLEAVWPEIGPRLLGAINADGVKAALEATPLDSDQVRFLIDHANSLAEFLKSDRWFMPPRARLATAFGSWATPEKQSAAQKAAMSLPPRQIACAMAGVPELSWRTSFARAQRSPCLMAVRSVTEEFYRIEFKLPWPKETWDRANRGEPRAQYHVGLSYAHGIGVPEDCRLAAEWYKRAAKLGEPEAQIALANLYRKGEGVEQNPELAYLWACMVPLTPDRQVWQAAFANDVATEKSASLRAAAQALLRLVQRLRFERSVRPLGAPGATETALLGELDASLKSAGE
ncbi:MAG: tetratricopeptide repeat protein [Candidatus Acidiferrales bacterium]